MLKQISVRGARTHNLKNINIDIPHNQFVVVTGPSGSGKSSLVFSTIYAEGQRRYVESLSVYARQFLSIMEKPDVDLIEGLSPSIAIEQKSVSHNPRSTVGTLTEIYDYLRLLFARIGTPICPKHQRPLTAQTITQMADNILTLDPNQRYALLAPCVRGRKGEHLKLLNGHWRAGYLRARINSDWHEIDTPPVLDSGKAHHIEIVIDRFKPNPSNRERLVESLEACLEIGNGLAIITPWDPDNSNREHDKIFSAKHACPLCDFNISDLEPRLFSFNSPHGACTRCNGLGMSQVIDSDKVILDHNLSVTQGGLAGWSKSKPYLFQMLSAVATHFEFSLETPIKDMNQEHLDLLLSGTGTEKITYVISGRRRKSTVCRPFPGIISRLLKRYQETESSSVQEEIMNYMSYKNCTSCDGARLKTDALCVKIADHNIHDLNNMAIDALAKWFKKLKLEEDKSIISSKITKEINDRLNFLDSVGLNYLSLERRAQTLSGGEAQRIRLASQIGSGLVGVTYVLDEPSIGLHQRDNQRLIASLMRLRDLGNNVIVVEHDEETMRMADHVIDIGPGAGVSGGEVVATGTAAEICANPKSLTGAYLSLAKTITPPKRLAVNPDKLLTITGVKCNNIKNLTVEIPLELFTCVTGVSGSGKSSLINDTLKPAIAKHLGRTTETMIGSYENISGLEHLDQLIAIDQSPIGRTPRSNPATYTGMFTPIRELFSNTNEASSRGYGPGRFSFNVKGGRCEKCAGDGLIRVEMHFMADVYVTCSECNGRRYNPETLEVKYKGKSIADVLALTINEASDFFDAIPQIKRKCDTIIAVGLGYIKLGQSATTLSGGEAQRIKLSRELAKRSTGNTFYILDEPTTGLHFHDINQLVDVLGKLRDRGNTIVVIEHNIDVIRAADWVIDIGPEGGNKGGELVASGPPEAVAMIAKSHTGRYLNQMMTQNTTPPGEK